MQVSSVMKDVAHLQTTDRSRVEEIRCVSYYSLMLPT